MGSNGEAEGPHRSPSPWRRERTISQRPRRQHRSASRTPPAIVRCRRGDHRFGSRRPGTNHPKSRNSASVRSLLGDGGVLSSPSSADPRRSAIRAIASFARSSGTIMARALNESTWTPGSNEPMPPPRTKQGTPRASSIATMVASSASESGLNTGTRLTGGT